MNKKIIPVIILFALFSISVIQSNAQTDTLKTEEHPTCINYQMIEYFKRNYDNIQVIPWYEILSQNSFEDIKLYYYAYNIIEVKNANTKEMLLALSKKVEEIKKEIDAEPDIKIKGTAKLELISK